jgi:hypothetical protein
MTARSLNQILKLISRLQESRAKATEMILVFAAGARR